MAFPQQYLDGLPDYPAVCSPLQDLGHSILPYLPTYFGNNSLVNSAADIWVIVSVVLFLISIGFGTRHPQLYFRRYFYIWGWSFVLRTLIVFWTPLPKLLFAGEKFAPSNPLFGALLILTGVKTTLKDFMFSGHTTTWVVTGWMTAYATNFGAWGSFLAGFNTVGIFCLLALQEHYTIDVGVGIIVSSAVWLIYHLIWEERLIRYFRPGFTIYTPTPVHLQYPITVTAKDGTQLVINGSGYLNTARWAAWSRFRLYQLGKWFDNPPQDE